MTLNKATPQGVGCAGHGVGDGGVALGKVEVEGVADSDGERCEDQVE